jgi:hypothetical protein
MLWLHWVAPAAIANVAVICVELTTVRPETVIAGRRAGVNGWLRR